MGKCIIRRNTTHPQQASDAPCTIESFKSLLGEAGFATVGDEVLLGIVDLIEINISNTQQTFFKQIKNQSGILSSPIIETIPVKQINDGFKNGERLLVHHQHEDT